MDTASNTLRRSLGSTLAILALSTSVSALAQAPDPSAIGAQTILTDATATDLIAPAPDRAVPDEASAPVEPANEAEPALFAGGAVDDELLASTSGREQSGAMFALTENSSKVSNNEVGDNVTTGDVNVQDSAFQNVSGISMVNFNTGNNSSINAAMSVNLQINFAPAAP